MLIKVLVTVYIFLFDLKGRQSNLIRKDYTQHVFNRTHKKGRFKRWQRPDRVERKRVNEDEHVWTVCYPFTFRNSLQNQPLKWSEKAVAQQQTKGTLSEPGSWHAKQQSIHRMQNMFIRTMEPLICSCKLCIWPIHFITESSYNYIVFRSVNVTRLLWFPAQEPVSWRTVFSAQYHSK